MFSVVRDMPLPYMVLLEPRKWNFIFAALFRGSFLVNWNEIVTF